SNQPAGRNPELESSAAASVIHHLGHGSAPRAGLGNDDSLEFFGDIDDQLFDWLHERAVHILGHDVGPGDLKLEAFAPHHLDQDRELQLTTPEHLHLLWRVGRFDFDRDVAEQLAIEAILDLS